MRLFRDRSIKTKLILLATASSSIALLLCCMGFVVNDVRWVRAALLKELQSQAAVLGFHSTAVLSFEDTAAAQQLLASLRMQPSIRFACLYTADGRVLATYAAEGFTEAPPPALAEEGQHSHASGDVELYHRVMDDGNVVGRLYLRASMRDLLHQFVKYSEIAAGVAVCALGASILLSIRLQRTISAPILHLATTAKSISSAGDYSIRVTREDRDELGSLYVAFNYMLNHIQYSEEALRKAHDELEERVRERTSQLREEIGRREKTQGELLRAKEGAEAANRAKSQFLANMSHEIRTPLNAILGFADLLRREEHSCSAEERHEFLDTILTSGKHLLSLINDILDLSKIEAERLDVEQIPCSPHQILSEIMSVLRVKALEKGLVLEYRWLSGVPATIRTDPARFRQLLVNLLSNAIKFTQVGSVKVLAELDRSGTEPRLKVQVVDTGVGIPAEKLEAIFDPFVQADCSVTREFGGTGLGLTISRRIAAALGGSLTVTSEMGKGSVFTATLATGPLDGVRIAASPPTDALRRTSFGGPQGPVEMPAARILLVEDGDTNRKLISLVLRRAGLEVATAANGQIAVDLALRHPFDLILMDMQMPVMDGYTAATRLRQQGLEVPIIALTAHAMKGDEQKCRDAGCSGYLTKPIDAELLLRTVAETLPSGRCAAESRSGGPPAADSPAGLVSTLPLDDPDFREIVEEFVERLQDQLASMKRAHAEKDMEELARLAHWLKGAGGTAGFPQFTAPARDLEQRAKDFDFDRAGAALDAVADLAGQIVIEPTSLPTKGLQNNKLGSLIGPK